MFRSYLVIAIRSLRKHKTVSFINILGLVLGMMVILFPGKIRISHFSARWSIIRK